MYTLWSRYGSVDFPWKVGIPEEMQERGLSMYTRDYCVLEGRSNTNSEKKGEVILYKH
jgi:hypothetical protein